MVNIDMTLLCNALEDVLPKLAAAPDDAAAWSEARSAVATYRVKEEDDPDLALAVEAEDADELASIVGGWVDGSRLMLVRDRDVLKRAMKAYRKRLKVTLLDAESSLSGGHLSSGRESDIVGIVPPERYPTATWQTLVRQGRLNDTGGGTYELGPKA